MELKKNITILVATPCYGGQVFQGYLGSVLGLQRICDKIGWNLIVKTHGNESLIPRGRNLYVAMTLGHKEIDYLLYIDADITFQPESVIRMVQEDKDITCGIYPKKGINWGKVSEITKNNQNVDNLEQKSLDYVVNIDNGHISIQKGFMRIKYGGTGFMLIKRGVIEKMVEAYPETKYTNDIQGYNAPELVNNFYALFDCIIHPESNRYLSEDYLFCERWTKIGGEIWADISTKLIHTGAYDFKGNFGDYILSGVQFIPDKNSVTENKKEDIVIEKSVIASTVPTPPQEPPKRIKFSNMI